MLVSNRRVGTRAPVLQQRISRTGTMPSTVFSSWKGHSALRLQTVRGPSSFLFILVRSLIEDRKLVQEGSRFVRKRTQGVFRAGRRFPPAHLELYLPQSPPCRINRLGCMYSSA